MKLEQKLTQKLAPFLTQKLKQALNLLIVPKLELKDAIEEELTQNPVLEVYEEENGRIEQEEDREILEWLERYSISEEHEEKEPPNYENLIRQESDLRDFLRWQVGLSDFDMEERLAAEWIIGNIDDNGYLDVPLEEISSSSGFDIEFLEKVLKKIQRLEPTGVGARDLRESLLLQYEAQEERDPIVEQILLNHFDLFQKNDLKEISRVLNEPLERIKEAVLRIRSFDPKPGRNYSKNDTIYVVPDVYVVKEKDGFEVYLNDEDLPELRLNRYYLNLYFDKKIDGKTKKYLKNKIREAQWFIRCIRQRQKTLYAVSKTIVNFQREFLEKGIEYLKPLTLRDVARELGLHESTISRITTNKFMSTDQGLFEMKFFFTKGILKENGDALSTNRVMSLIKEIVEKEDKRNPLTDDEIAEILKKEQGIRIARRTVAKYREILNIKSSRERRID